MKLKEKMKNNKHKKFDKKKLIGTISKKHIKNGSYTMVDDAAKPTDARIKNGKYIKKNIESKNESQV